MRRTHGMSHTRLHNIWLTMRQRCEKPKSTCYHKYGAKGIKVCEEWGSFENFRDWAYSHGYDDTLTIDRIDPKGDYSPKNCRWATQKEQQNNRSNNVKFTYNGVTKTLMEWSELVGIPYSALYCRVYRGWSVERVFSPLVREAHNKGKRFTEN